MRLGDERRVKFWEDTWCEERSLKQEFEDIYVLVVDPKALVATNVSGNGGAIVWNLALRRNLFNWEIPRVTELLARLQASHINLTQEDRRVWKAASEGEFSVRSCYVHVISSRTYVGLWKEVWNHGLPPKVQFFMWTTVLEKISTMDALWRKGFSLPSICLLCYHDAESITHLFIHCPFSWES